VIEVTNFDSFFEKGTKDENLWKAIAKLCGYDKVEDFLANYFSHKTISKWDSTFNDEIAPRVLESLLDNTISISPFPSIDFTPTAKYHGGSFLIRLNLRTNTSLARKAIADIKINYAKTILNSSDFWAFTTFSVENVNINYTTKHYEGFIINKYIGDKLSDNVPSISTPMNSDEQRNPRVEDKYLVLKLIEHLNSNLEHYNKTLWFNLDPDRRYMLLDGFNIQIYNDFGVPAGTRSLASVVKNELLTVTGNSLVFPVAAGYKVSQSYISEKNQQGKQRTCRCLITTNPTRQSRRTASACRPEASFWRRCKAIVTRAKESKRTHLRIGPSSPRMNQPLSFGSNARSNDYGLESGFQGFCAAAHQYPERSGSSRAGSGLDRSHRVARKIRHIQGYYRAGCNQQNVIRTYLSNQENARRSPKWRKVWQCRITIPNTPTRLWTR